MARKMAALVVAAITAGATGYAVFAQQPQGVPAEWKQFQPNKATRKWEYCTLTETKLDNKGSVAVIVEGGGLVAVCNGGWLDAAKKLGLEVTPGPVANDPGFRKNALDQMGALGWELVGTHRGDLDRLVWVFKRER